MGRNTPANRKAVKTKIDKKKQKDKEAEVKRKAQLKEIVRQFTQKSEEE